MGKNYDLLSIASLYVVTHLWGRKNIKTFIIDHWKQFSYLYFLPDIRIFVLTLDVLQQLVHQGCTSSAVHQGSCQMQPAVCRPPSLIFIRLQVTQRTGLYAFVQWGGNIAGGGGAKATDEVSSVRELRRREGKKKYGNIYSGLRFLRQKHERRQKVTSYLWKRRRNIAFPYLPVRIKLCQIPVIYVLQSVLGGITATRPLLEKVKQKL